MISGVRVPSDPAEVNVSHVSFRVRFGPAPGPPPAGFLSASPGFPRFGSHAVAPDVGVPLPAPERGGSPGPAPGVPARGARVMRAGGGRGGYGRAGSLTVDRPPGGVVPASRPGEPPAGGAGLDVTQPLTLIPDAGTRLLPRVGVDGAPEPTVVGPRVPGEPFAGEPFPGGPFDDEPEERPRAGEPVPRTWHPHRRRNPGKVLLPLRIFLGSISVYAGMGKLCDPVYFDGGERGSMVQWLSSLHPWAAAAPLHDFALSHPVGAGLTVAFLQIMVGTLSVLGLWQRAAAGVGMLLSAALLLTVSWRTVPVYEAPDIVFLAAWSPLLITGAPYCSLDARLAKQAWRRLGPRTSVAELRRWVLRRGTVVATVVTGSTLLVGSLLGGAVRAGTFRTDLPDPSAPPTNNLPGSPLPQESDDAPDERPGSASPSSGGSVSPSATPSDVLPSTAPPETSAPSTAGPGEAASTAGTAATQSAGTGATQAPEPAAPADTPPPAAPPTAGATTGGSSGGEGGSEGGSDGSSGGALGGLLGKGGLLGMEGHRGSSRQVDA